MLLRRLFVPTLKPLEGFPPSKTERFSPFPPSRLGLRGALLLSCGAPAALLLSFLPSLSLPSAFSSPLESSAPHVVQSATHPRSARDPVSSLPDPVTPLFDVFVPLLEAPPLPFAPPPLSFPPPLPLSLSSHSTGFVQCAPLASLRSGRTCKQPEMTPRSKTAPWSPAPPPPCLPLPTPPFLFPGLTSPHRRSTPPFPLDLVRARDEIARARQEVCGRRVLPRNSAGPAPVLLVVFSS